MKKIIISLIAFIILLFTSLYLMNTDKYFFDGWLIFLLIVPFAFGTFLINFWNLLYNIMNGGKN